MDRDLSRFIANGRLACTIDKVSGVITTNKLASQNKTVVYEQVVKQGDILLSGELSLRRTGPEAEQSVLQTSKNCIEWSDERVEGFTRLCRECRESVSISRKEKRDQHMH